MSHWAKEMSECEAWEASKGFFAETVGPGAQEGRATRSSWSGCLLLGGRAADAAQHPRDQLDGNVFVDRRAMVSGHSADDEAATVGQR